MYYHLEKYTLVKTLLLVLLFQSYGCKPVTPTSSIQINGETKIRYIEMYGSICCPRDYKYDNQLVNYIKTFESNNKVKLTSNYKMSLGKEGETAYFLSLESLTEELQEKFINERLETLKKDDQSVINHLKNPISINQAIKLWENKSLNNLKKI